MMIDTRPRYRVKEKIIAKGYENEITIPYKGKSLEKIFDKGSIVVGQTKNIGGQNIFSVFEISTGNTFDKDTKQPFVGRVEFALDPSKIEIFDAKDEAQKQINVNRAIAIGQAPPSQQEPVSDLEYYLSPNFLKRASVSIVPIALIGAYCYNKKFSLTKSALLVSIPIVAITGLQYLGMGGGKNAYWGIFVPPSARANSMKQIQLMPKTV